MIQICGTILIGLCLICLTWYGVTLMQMKAQKADDARKRREARNERMTQANWSALYEEERQRRIDAETREQIAKDQLRRAREQMATMMIKEVR